MSQFERVDTPGGGEIIFIEFSQWGWYSSNVLFSWGGDLKHSPVFGSAALNWFLYDPYDPLDGPEPYPYASIGFSEYMPTVGGVQRTGEDPYTWFATFVDDIYFVTASFWVADNSTGAGGWARMDLVQFLDVVP